MIHAQRKLAQHRLRLRIGKGCNKRKQRMLDAFLRHAEPPFYKVLQLVILAPTRIKFLLRQTQDRIQPVHARKHFIHRHLIVEQELPLSPMGRAARLRCAAKPAVIPRHRIPRIDFKKLIIAFRRFPVTPRFVSTYTQAVHRSRFIWIIAHKALHHFICLLEAVKIHQHKRHAVELLRILRFLLQKRIRHAVCPFIIMRRMQNHGKIAHRLHVLRILPQHSACLRRCTLVIPHAKISKGKVVACICKLWRKRERMLKGLDGLLITILFQKAAPFIRKVVGPVLF